MREQPRRSQQGFTLIELVIVLAVAALVLLGILLAVHGAQISRQNEQRKSDATKIGADLEAAASNREGCYPTQTCTFATGITNTKFRSSYTNQILTPDGTVYNVNIGGTYGTCPTPGSLTVDKVEYSFSASHQWQVAVGLDNGKGGKGDVYCATGG